MGSVFVTGAARGIGRATVARLAAAGWDVVAGVRRAQDAEAVTALDPARIRAVTVELTDPAAIAGLDSALPTQLDAIVNNAGIVVGGPIEAVSPAELRRQLEVNVVAQSTVTQAVLGRLRASRGRIVFVSSISGFVSTPMMGAYSASKFALEGMADALRMELAPWGIKVVLVEPGQTDTDLWRDAEDQLDATVAAFSDEHRRLYAKHIDGMRKSIPRSQKMATSVEGAAATIERALTARHPRARYVVGRPAQLQAAMARLTPTPVLDLVLRAGTGVPWRAR